MPWDSILTYCGVFLSGALVGAAGKYLADRFTDQRRGQEARSAAAAQLAAVEGSMPDLLREMRSDLAGALSVRRCVVFPSPGVARMYGSSQLTFQYLESEHDDLRGKFDILENCGYVTRVPVGSGQLPTFTLTEAFVALLRG